MHVNLEGVLYMPHTQVVRVWDVTSGECAFEFSADVGDSGISAIDIDHSGRR